MLRERAGSERIEVELAEGATVADAIAVIGSRQPFEGLFERLPVRMAVNREYAEDATRLAPGDELALIPPVSGGAGAEVHARVTDEPLDPGALARSVRRPGAGAVVTFEGLTREVDRLEYEAYSEMAEPRIAAILAGCVAEHGLEAAAAEHRIGEVPLSEPSVVVAVSGAHREETFAAARAAIDLIKAEVPIWKREVDGVEGQWVKGTTPG